MDNVLELRQKAWKFAAAKHQGQLYPGGEHFPYIMHIGGVLLEIIPALAENGDLNADLAVCCALLQAVNKLPDASNCLHWTICFYRSDIPLATDVPTS